MKKALQIIAILILVVLPFYPITENFFPPEQQVNNETFGIYLAICAGIIVLGILLILFQKPKGNVAGWLLFAIGLTAMIPLHLGPPRMNVDLLNASDIEKFRYGLLIIATLLLFFAGLKIITPFKSIQSKIILIILCITTLLNLWDNYSSFMLNHEMEKWIADGKDADTFIFQFDHQLMWRTFARISLYVTAISFTFVLIKNNGIKKWQFAILNIFCLAGIVFCVLCLLNNFENYYFPFMVPAIALAPAYWTGIAILTNKKLWT